MKKIFLLGLLLSSCILLQRCRNNSDKASREVSSVWPHVAVDTLLNPDFSADSVFGFDEDSIYAEYEGGVYVKHNLIVIDSTRYYIVEGDLLLDEYRYNQYRLGLSIAINAAIVPQDDQKALRVLVSNGKAIRWPENDIINFCINKKSFRDNNSYELAKISIRKAMSEWMNICNVEFFYDSSYDNSNFIHANDKVDFVVLEYDAGGAFIAKSFFPNSAAGERNLIIDPSYYTTQFDKVGVFRHELGHILGFSHEHASRKAPRVCQGEIISGTMDVTKYDPKSVMHYFCGGMGTMELKLTDLDIKGSRDIYGMPARHMNAVR